MRKKEMIAMLLAGGQGSRLGILTKTKAKPAVSYGGKFRMIDFPLSNCVNSGIDTVGVLTQYLPLLLNRHIGDGVPWDLDRNNGGVTILQPHQKNDNTGNWYSGSANAVYQNIEYIEEYSPDYVLVLGGDHIYKMDYSIMLDFHKENNADATIAVIEVPMEEASRYGIMNTREDGQVYEFAEKPEKPVSNLASMGIYIFTWHHLREILSKAEKLYQDSDFGKHIIPMMIESGKTLYAWKYEGYWRDVGTIDSYWDSNMELVTIMPKLDLYDVHQRIYTSSTHQPPQYLGRNSDVRDSVLSEGCEVFGTVLNSVLGPGVIVKEGAVIKDSIIMEYCMIYENAVVERSILDERCVIGKNARIGTDVGEYAINQNRPDIYNTGITVLGEFSTVPEGASVGKNCVIDGATIEADYVDGQLFSGMSIIKERQAKA